MSEGPAPRSNAGIDGITKLFVGGLSWDTTDERLRDYFAKFGAVADAIVMKERGTGRSRGFGFVVFEDERDTDHVAGLKHELDGRQIEAKKAIPRDAMSSRGFRTKKIFVGGLPLTLQLDSFRAYFEKFGSVVDAEIMEEKETRRPRGFGFVTFSSEETVDSILGGHHEIEGKTVEVKKAEPKRNAPGGPFAGYPPMGRGYPPSRRPPMRGYPPMPMRRHGYDEGYEYPPVDPYYASMPYDYGYPRAPYPDPYAYGAPYYADPYAYAGMAGAAAPGTYPPTASTSDPAAAAPYPGSEAGYGSHGRTSSRTERQYHPYSRQ